MLTETWLNNQELVNIPNFDCCVQFKREDQRSGGVAIYRNRNSAIITTPNMDITYRQTTSSTVTSRPIGDICSAECILPNGQTVLSVVVYISPNQQMDNIIKFLNFVLLPYSKFASEELGSEFFNMPIIMGGDFNINFDKEESELLLKFLEEKYNLRLNTNRHSPTTQHQTTIDAVFSRNLGKLESKLFITYFSYHRPIISCIKQ